MTRRAPSDPPAAVVRFARELAADPRHYQMSVQAALLGYGLFWLDFETTAARCALTIAACLGAQWLGSRYVRPGPFEWRSALISGLGLCLLLRAASPLLLIVTAALSVLSKFVIRWRGKHLFNPTCFGLTAMLALRQDVWVSPGQWGHAAFAGFAIGCLGSIVVTRAARADVSLGFLGAWALIVFGRAAWLGQPWITPLHMMSSGSLLLFAFFMISDPRSTPDSRIGRLIFVALVAIGTALVQFGLYRTNGLLWSLSACALLVPLIDRWLPGARHRWRKDADSFIPKGTSHVPVPTLAPAHA